MTEEPKHIAATESNIRIVTKIAMAAAGLILGIITAEEAWIASLCRQEPQRLTCAELAANGPGDNAYVIVTDVYAPVTWYVYKADLGDEDGPYEYVYTPLVDPGSPWFQKVLQDDIEHGENRPVSIPTDVGVFAKFKDIRNGRQLAGKLDRYEFEGLIINEFESVEEAEKRLITEAFPGADPDDCWVLEVDRRPWSANFVGGALAVSGGLFLVGVGWIVRDAVKQRRSRPPAVPAPPEAKPSPADTPARETSATALTDDDKNPYARNG
ncbi:MAG: hypothetical protein ACYTFO_01625 [Planctomycetota bacterium]